MRRKKKRENLFVRFGDLESKEEILQTRLDRLNVDSEPYLADRKRFCEILAIHI